MQSESEQKTILTAMYKSNFVEDESSGNEVGPAMAIGDID